MGVTANGHVVSLWGKGNIPELDNGGGWHSAVNALHATTVCFQMANFRVFMEEVCVDFSIKQSQTSKAPKLALT